MFSSGLGITVGAELECGFVGIDCRLGYLRLLLSFVRLSDVDQEEPGQSGRDARARAQQKSET